MVDRCGILLFKTHYVSKYFGRQLSGETMMGQTSASPKPNKLKF